MGLFIDHLAQLKDAVERSRYVDELAMKLSNSEEGEWLAYELSRLYSGYLHELGDCREEDIKKVRGRIEMVRDLFARLRMASVVAEHRRAERNDRGSRRWTPVLSEDPGLL